MNGRTRVKGQLPADKAVTDRGTGKGLRGEGQGAATTLEQRLGGDKQALQHTFTAEPLKPISDDDKLILTEYDYNYF